MIHIEVRSNSRAVLAELRVDQAKIKKASVQALNRTAEQLRTEAGREIRKASQILRASARSILPRAELTFAGRPIPLIQFDARAVNPWNVKGRRHNKRGGGVTVQIRVGEPRKLVAGAFISALTANNARGGGAAGLRAVFRRQTAERESIKNLRSISIPKAAARDAIADALVRIADSRFSKNYDDALRYQLRG
jgi:hypothetical protein